MPSKDARAHFLAWGIKCNNQKCLRWRHKFTWLSKTCKTSTESIFKQIISPTACKRVQKSRCQFHIIIFENGAEKPSKDARAHFLACGIKCRNSKVSQVTAQVHMLLKSFQNIKRKYFQTPCRTSCVRMVLKIQMQRLFDDFSKFSSKCLQKMLEHIF